MATLNIQAFLPYSVEKVWNTVTSLENYQWRSDLQNIKIFEGGKRFVEYTKDGYATEFKITAFCPMIRYEFDMENANIFGHWVGIFSEEEGGCSIDFTEIVSAKKMMLKPFVKGYLKKQQAVYITDLKKSLEYCML